MALFLIIVFLVYFLVNLYLFLKGFRILSSRKNLKTIYVISFVLFASSFIAGKILEVKHSSDCSDFLNLIGGFWLAFMLYGSLIFLLSDITYPILRATGLLAQNKIFLFRKWAYYSTLLISSVTIIAGFINALNPVVRHYEIEINKNAGDLKEFRIAAVSDIHLGSVIGKRNIEKLSKMLVEVKPDAVFLLGDIVDGEIGPVIRNDLLKYFDCSACRDSLLAITGNHEFIGNPSVSIPYIENKGIRILKDEMVVVRNYIQVIGRIDRFGASYSSYHREQLEKLMENTDPGKPVIVLDHQPLELAEAEKAGVDLQLSGHTHNGQLWPLNYITGLFYEISKGYGKKGNTHVIVSSGFGLWGPMVRTGSRPEIVVVDIKFNRN